jgi:hypothetical protein
LTDVDEGDDLTSMQQRARRLASPLAAQTALARG